MARCGGLQPPNPRSLSPLLTSPLAGYGVQPQVMDVAGEYILSNATGSRILEFDMGDEPSYNVFAARSLDARDINGADAHTKRLGVALMSRSYPTEKLHWTTEKKKKKKGQDSEGEDGDSDSDESGEPDTDESGESLGSEDTGVSDAPSASKKRKVVMRGAAASAAQPSAAAAPAAGKSKWPPALVPYEAPFISRDRIKEVCEALSNSTVAWDPAIIKERGQFLFNSAPAHHRPGKDEFSSLPLFLSRRFSSFIYDPVRRYTTAGGFAALCKAIAAAHHGRPVDRLYLQDGDTVGGWGARLPDPLAGGNYNTYTCALALEKQVEYNIPLVKPEPTGPVYCATELETRASAHPVLQFASLLLKPQVRRCAP